MDKIDLSALFSLQGKVAMVTGATSGIGRRQALVLAAAGASVVAVARRREQLDSLAETIAASSGNCTAIEADLLQADCDALASQACEAYGRVDILCNTAGVNLREPADEISRESWEKTLWLNLSVPFFMARALEPQMRGNGGGRVINIASLQSERAFANSMAYGASKGGVAQLTRAMAEGWSANGICCNAIAPGFFPTELTAAVFANDEISQKNARQTAIGRNGEMQDLDGVTVFLASAASSYITGQIIYVDGGFTAK
jgi:NAD(P)-dependent dehydrogenase (short-subunit alcohol dehydrogenase family)